MLVVANATGTRLEDGAFDAIGIFQWERKNASLYMATSVHRE